MKKFCIGIWSALALFSVSPAAIRLPALVGDNMVLQRDTEVNVWGWADPGTTVSVVPSWNGEEYRNTADGEGRWSVRIATPEAGGPHTVTITDGGDRTVLRNVMSGEVWFCAGQSNMEMPLKGFTGQRVAEANETVAHAGKYKNLRLFTIKRARSESPLDDVEGQWKIAAPASALDFSATAYYFGRNLTEILDVPVGLICSAWGGTRIEAWRDDETISEYDRSDKNGMYTLLFNGMVMPAVNYGIAGFLWYQGEGNADNPERYSEKLDRMVRLWRNKWGSGNLPFYFAQIAPYNYDYLDGGDGIAAARIREEQLKALNLIPNSGMAVTIDMGDATNIHPAAKRVVGERLSYWALAKTYGVDGIWYRSPELSGMEIVEGKAVVKFDYAETGLAPWDIQVNGFEIAGADKVFYPAVATVDKTGKRNSVTVYSEKVKNPVAVRYCFRNTPTPDVNLFNLMGLPASPFRTDFW